MSLFNIVYKSILYLIIFTGSVFITSGKFVNATNTPKYYFVFSNLLILLAITAIHKKKINLGVLYNKAILWGISIICFLQACYGLCQFLGWLPSNHSKFAITGSFDNPAGFAAILAMGFPIGLYLLAMAKKVERYLSIAGLIVIVIAVFLSESRSGMLAILISSLVFFLIQSNIISMAKLFRYYKLFSILVLVLLIAVAFIFYHHKKDSANGRLIIWKVSSEMIMDKPFLGHGYGAFRAKYMTYQAEYFKNNSDSKYALLADNVKHPFNEFIKVSVEFGIVGLIVVLSLFLFVLWKIIKSENENRGLVFSGLVSFQVLACFSYPLQYIAVWFLLVFYLLALLPSNEIRIKHSPISIIARIVVVIACTISFFHFTKQIQAEIKWKEIAVSSLRGNIEKMLPKYEKLYSTSLKKNCYFLYNYGAELNFTGRFDKSIDILTECQQRFNDYDLQMLLAYNYSHVRDKTKAIELYKHAGNMIPCRFLPLYRIFEIYKISNQNEKAFEYATKIINKKVKVPSSTVHLIKIEAQEFIDKRKQ